MTNPKVSIIVPNYNHAQFLDQRLDTVFNQTYKNFEVILLDDASTDGSQEILKLYKNHPKVTHLILNSKNSGTPFKQWKKGISLAQGDYIWIAESDDFCELSFLETLIPSLTEETGLIYCQTKDVDEKGGVLFDRVEYTSKMQPNFWLSDFEMEGAEFINKGLLVKNVIPNASAVVFKKSLVKPSFFLNSLLDMKMCGDWFFWMQLTKNTKVKFIKQHLNYFRNHKSISRIHEDHETRKKRLLEESSIRCFSESKYGLISHEMNLLLYKKWFNLHDKFSLFSSKFYRVKQPSTSRLNLLLNFIQFKLKNS
ncbi:glycosyltransferase [Psychroflexus sp. YR1-1]|uniref:Glycosyltransferase n=1 Tax=Psychroflexus aurantiacus TaxID=2709310 RepID=A0A6B3R1M9_9FLAO|nr:glycosyltransferase family 2 protein [Psychroflexus aurantiacus]NEV93948.1 glycosyltransferase [Psychroflexus aurantiacus]